MKARVVVIGPGAAMEREQKGFFHGTFQFYLVLYTPLPVYVTLDNAPKDALSRVCQNNPFYFMRDVQLPLVPSH